MTPDQRTFREITRTVSVDYPIPFLFATLLAFALACFGLALARPDPIGWLFAALGCVCAVAALVIVFYAILRRNDLLRSERHSLMTRAIGVAFDKDAPEGMRDRAGRIIDGLFEGERMSRKRTTGGHVRSPVENKDDASKDDADG